MSEEVNPNNLQRIKYYSKILDNPVILIREMPYFINQIHRLPSKFPKKK
jgi:hypothetical protein